MVDFEDSNCEFLRDVELNINAGEFYINILETNYFRHAEPRRIAIHGNLSVGGLIAKVVDTYGK